jgi:hypothetical protein
VRGRWRHCCRKRLTIGKDAVDRRDEPCAMPFCRVPPLPLARRSSTRPEPWLERPRSGGSTPRGAEAAVVPNDPVAAVLANLVSFAMAISEIANILVASIRGIDQTHCRVKTE